ncbi:MAG: CpsD/CapB family tyrosine-protein kinase [Bacteroides sp.]|nr:CpsD/CapB family tyrosine-protein kinase [Eubacterium sp.]MCM1417994.1 CpsD/CapB family tyrosine-protein kinase [Roseburia sp.]MCM1462183.1 CpsD/CapB family tyrosine-protein kinase [Bacteroides sp.]
MAAYSGADADFITRQFILNENTPPLIMETYKNIRTHLLFAMKSSGLPCVAITSQCKNEGKTTTAANLAIALGMLDKRVLLIDADLRRPSLGGLFRLKSRFGLSTALKGESDLLSAISPDVLRNFHVMPSGPVPENPADLLGGANMERLIRLLYDFYDFIILDTPPLSVANDALLFGGYTAGVALVVRENRTTHSDVKKALLTISLARANLIGAIKTYCSSVKDEVSDYKSLLLAAEEEEEREG